MMIPEWEPSWNPKPLPVWLVVVLTLVAIACVVGLMLIPA